ncbi:MAG: hypothetical protein JW834_02250, partial [Candidatus Diapherotrites archaeon]|nr:hypothetical protein [Candidatus Diapherotrites archaeon]
GSLEYLLILAAVLAIAVVVVVVANQMLAPAQAAAGVSEDKYRASVEGIELEGYSSLAVDAADARSQIRIIKYLGDPVSEIASRRSVDKDLVATFSIGRDRSVIVDVYGDGTAAVYDAGSAAYGS